MKVLALAALLCQLASATDCTAGKCIEDEMSLMQKSTVVQHRPAKDLQTAELLSHEDIVQLVRNAEERAFKEAEEEVGKHGDEDDFSDEEEIPNMEFIAPYYLDTAVPAIEEPEFDSGMTDDKAILESMGSEATVATGSVTGAWESALANTKGHIKAAAADSIAFKNKVHDERKAANARTVAAVAANKRAVKTALEADASGVRAAFDRRLAVQRAAIRKMTLAREAYEAEAAKKHQVADYATAGRLEGADEGATDAWAKRQALPAAYAAERYDLGRHLVDSIADVDAAAEAAALGA